MSDDGRKRRPPAGLRKRVAAIDVGGGPAPAGMRQAVGIRFTEGTFLPGDIFYFSSATYSLGSTGIPTNLERIAVLSYSMSSPNIPTGMMRVALLPDV